MDAFSFNMSMTYYYSLRDLMLLVHRTSISVAIITQVIAAMHAFPTEIHSGSKISVVIGIFRKCPLAIRRLLRYISMKYKQMMRECTMLEKFHTTIHTANHVYLLM